MKKLIVVTFFLSVACHSPKDTENCHYSIKFKNNTSRVLFIDSRSDTIIKSYMDPRRYYEDTAVLPHAGNNYIEMGSIYFIRNGSPMCIEDLYEPDEKLYIFVYDSIALGNKDWYEVKKNYLITKRYDLTLRQLKAMNFQIVYDGN